MPQPNFREPAQETHEQSTVDDNTSTAATVASTESVGSPNNIRANGFDNDEEIEQPGVDFPRAPPPTRVNSLADRRGRTTVRGSVFPATNDESRGMTQGAGTQGGSHVGHVQTEAEDPCVMGGPVRDPAYTEGSQHQNNNEQPSTNANQRGHNTISWVLGDPDQDTENIWESFSPGEGSWNVEVTERFGHYYVRGNPVGEVTVILTEL